MERSLSILQSPIVLLLIGLTGYALKNTRFSHKRDLVGKVNVYILLPLLLYNSFVKRGMRFSDIWIASAALVFTIISLPVLLLITRGIAWRTRASILITSMMPNAINIPFPLLQATLGDYSYAAIYAVAINLIQIIIVVALAGYVTTVSRKKELVNMLKLMAPIYGAAVGAIAHNLGYIPTGSQAKALNIIGDIAIDSIVLVAGLSLPDINDVRKGDLRELRKVILWRHVVSPIITLLYLLLVISRGVIFPEHALKEVMVEAVMPPALINASFSLTYGFDEKLTGKAIMFSTPIGIIMGLLLALLPY